MVDAISWVLGEQSHKSLRAERMADCIFNGTTKRPPMGLAEVTITMEDPELAEAARFVIEGVTFAEIVEPSPLNSRTHRFRRRRHRFEPNKPPPAEMSELPIDQRSRPPHPTNPSSSPKNAKKPKSPPSSPNPAKSSSAAACTAAARANT